MTFVSAIEAPGEPASRRVWFVVAGGGLLLRQGEGGVVLPQEQDEGDLGLDPAGAHYLGRLDGADAYAARGEAGGGFEARGLRGLSGPLTEEQWGVAGRALQIVEWAETHRFCGRCAAPTERVRGERCTRCPACGLTTYPRIAPAIIVLVRRGDEALLARGARFPAAFYSTLAGFSEPGETLEETLAREVREEVGVEVRDIRYFGSQSWPFPHSLMVGFQAEWAGGEIAIDPAEIVDAGWYKADALPAVPPRLSIARRLIDCWVEDVLGPR